MARYSRNSILLFLSEEGQRVDRTLLCGWQTVDRVQMVNNAGIKSLAADTRPSYQLSTPHGESSCV